MRSGTCASARALSPFCLEHEVEPAEALETARHLSACPGCAVEAERDRRLLSALREIGEPAPPRDIASGVISLLRRMKAGAPAPRALKWSAIGLLGALLALDALRPEPGAAAGWRLLARLGELMYLDVLADRFGEFLSRLLVPPSSISEVLLGAGAAAQAGAGAAAPQAPFALLLGAALLLALLTTFLVAGGLVLARPAGRLRRGLRRLF